LTQQTAKQELRKTKTQYSTKLKTESTNRKAQESKKQGLISREVGRKKEKSQDATSRKVRTQQTEKSGRKKQKTPQDATNRKVRTSQTEKTGNLNFFGLNAQKETRR
jgi:hypothetical protein